MSLRSRISPSSQRLAALVTIFALVTSACASDTKASSKPTAPGATSTSTSTPHSAAPTTTTQPAGPSMRAKRYCEVLLLHPNAAGFQADVFNSYPLNDCRQSRWKKLNAVTIAKRQRATLAVLNGPRYWLMDHIDKTQDANIVRARFGGIEMIQRATVQIKSVVEASKPFARNHVNRQTTFTFDGGATIYELTAADGTTFVMQSWSQQIDPILSEADLAKLATRIHPPAGWRYSVRTLETPLRVVTQASDAVVIQDDLKNSYSLETSK